MHEQIDQSQARRILRTEHGRDAMNYEAHEPISPLNSPFFATFFKSYAASEKDEQVCTMRDLSQKIRCRTADSKAHLPWLKLARFGDRKTDKGSLRNDENVLAVTGVEVDYDGGLMTVDEAVERLTKAGIAAMVYTSPSHTNDVPRWRVLCPLSKEIPADRRQHLVGRLNGLFNGIFAGESFTLSQAYYYGSINRNPAHRVELIDGAHLDEQDDLDAMWIGKPQTIARPGSATSSGAVDMTALLSEIVTGAGYHTASVRIAGAFARQRIPFMEARQRLVDAMQAVPENQRDARWRERFADLDRIVIDIYGREARTLDQITLPDSPDAITDEAYWQGVEDQAAGVFQDQSHAESYGSYNHSMPMRGKAEIPSDFTSAHFTNPTTLAGLFVPDRNWVVQDWLPVGTASAAYGDGGVGKTLLSQQLMTSCATRKPWCGLAVMPCKSLGLFCEDDPDELHRRQEQINQALGLNFGDLGDMRWMSGVGQDNTMVNFNSDGRMLVAKLFHAVKAAALEFGAKLVVLDTAADLFAGNENDRHQVRQFIGLLSGLAIEIGGAVLLNAHPSRTGLSTGNLDGGSTAWSNSVRSRWSLGRPPGDTLGTDEDADARVLTRRKANYARVGDTIQLRWADGVLAPPAQKGGVFGGVNVRMAAEEVFLTLLDRCADQGVHVSHVPQSGNYAPKVFAQRQDREGHSKQEFQAAMTRLLEAKRIRNEGFRGPNRNWVQLLEREKSA